MQQSHTARLEVIHRGQKMRQRPTEAIQFPDNQTIARPEEG